MRAKVDEYLTHGMLLVLIVDPEEGTVTVCRRLLPPVVLGMDDELDPGDVVHGFRRAVREKIGASF